jgi:cytochrome bd ubiquinol oxidase subunit I
MELSALLLSRVQFAFTIGYHILFPTLTMGLAVLLVVLDARALATGRALYRQASLFWSRVFALAFGMGVVTGVVLSYELGTNWGRYSEFAGPIVGPLISYEVMSAFFLEAGFLGIMLFGRRRVKPGVHFFATCMVAIGTLFSAFWVLSANSFMQTPAGYSIEHGMLRAADWTAVVFNPSFPYRFAHMTTATYLSTSFVVIAVGAWYLLRGRDPAAGAEGAGQIDFGRANLRWGLRAAAVLAPLQIFLGDLHGLNTLEHQPMKIAAMEAHWETGSKVPLVLFALPDPAAETNRYALEIPRLGSLILTHDAAGVVKGLKEVPPQDRPPVAIVFWSFRVMVGCGLLMLALSWLGLLLGRGGRALPSWLLRPLLLAGPLGFVAVIAGWITTECGRQPWVVYGLQRTADAVSLVATADVVTSLAAFVAGYALLFAVFATFFRRLVRNGMPEDPQAHAPRPERGAPRPAFITTQDEPR